MGMISIRAIGAPTGSTAAVAGAYMDYLSNGVEMKGKVATETLDGTIEYYDSGIEGPGMWHGHGAEHLGLSGFVEPHDLNHILQGRHHETGERLLSASGSAGRHSLKVGQATRQHEGQPVWSHHDLATHLDLTDDELTEFIDAVGVNPLRLDDGDHFNFADVQSLADVVGVTDQSVKLDSIDDEQLVTAGVAASTLGVSRRYINMVIGNAQDYDVADTSIEDRDKDWLEAERNDPTNPKSQWRIKGEHLKAFAARRQPPAVRLAYDATFTLEKSISVVGLLSEGETRDVFAQAVTDANRTALDHLDQHASNGRERAAPIGSEGLAVASFMHATSRNNDPFLHVHNLVVNSIQDENGQGRALDARDLYLQGPTASALGSIELRWQLAQKLGLQFEATGNSVEIAGVHADVIDGFSTGRNRIESIVEEAGIDINNPAARQHAATNSRPDKDTATPDDLQHHWWDRAADLGFTRGTLDYILNNPAPLPSPELSDAERGQLFEHLATWQGATRDASIFTRSDVIRAIGEWSPDGHVRVMPSDVANETATQFLTSELVVPLEIDKRQVAKLVGKVSPALHQRDVFTTQNVLDTQRSIDSMWTDGLTGTNGITSAEHLRAGIDHVGSLTSEQHDLVTQWVSSGHQFQSATGVPGAGKTFAVSAARHAWQAQGYTVIGAAISGTAAQHLGDDAGIPSETVASYLHQIYDQGNNPLDANTILVVDEAGTIPDRDLHSLMAAATDAGATVRLLGDPAQHGSVEAGGMWHHLTETYAANTPALTHSFRFQDSPVDVDANTLVRDGQFKEAFDLLRAHGQLTEVDSHDQALGALLRRSVNARDAGTPAPMIERTNASRVALNGAMQHIRAERGEVTNLTQFGIRQYGIGDEIISKTNDRQLAPHSQPEHYLRNGTQGVITNITTAPGHEPIVTADFGHGDIPIRGERFATPDFDLSYAVTSHAVQGATLPISNSAIGAGVTHAETVVDLSRGLTDNHLVLYGDRHEELSSLYDRPEPRHLGDRIAQTVAPGDNIPAAAVDQDAGGRDINLARLHARNAPDDAISFARSVHTRHIEANPPRTLTDQLPEPSTVPHLARSQTQAIVDASLYQLTYIPYPARDVPYGDTLGQRPEPTEQNQPQLDAYDEALSALTSAAQRTALREIYSHDPSVPEWVNGHVADLAAQGRLTPTLNVDTFTQWAHAANHHHSTHGMFPTGKTPDALTDAAGRAQHEHLAQTHADALNPPKPPSNLDLNAGTDLSAPAPRPRAIAR